MAVDPRAGSFATGSTYSETGGGNNFSSSSSKSPGATKSPSSSSSKSKSTSSGTSKSPGATKSPSTSSSSKSKSISSGGSEDWKNTTPSSSKKTQQTRTGFPSGKSDSGKDSTPTPSSSVKKTPQPVAAPAPVVPKQTFAQQPSAATTPPGSWLDDYNANTGNFFTNQPSLGGYRPDQRGEMMLRDMLMQRSLPNAVPAPMAVGPLQGPNLPAPEEETSIAARYLTTPQSNFDAVMGLGPLGFPALQPAPQPAPALPERSFMGPDTMAVRAATAGASAPQYTIDDYISAASGSVPRPAGLGGLGGMSLSEFNETLPPEAAFLPEGFGAETSPLPQMRPGPEPTRPEMRPPQPVEELGFSEFGRVYGQPITSYTTRFDAPIAPGVEGTTSFGAVPGAPSVPGVGALPSSQLPPAPVSMSGMPNPFLEEILPGSPGARGAGPLQQGVGASRIPPDLDTSTPVAGDLPLGTDYQSYALPGPAPEAVVSPPPLFFGGSLNSAAGQAPALSAGDDRYAASVPGFALPDQARQTAPRAGIASLPVPAGDFAAPQAFLEEILPGSPGVRGVSVIPQGTRPSTIPPDLDTSTPVEGDLPLRTDYGEPRPAAPGPSRQAAVPGFGALPEIAPSSAARVPPSFDDALNIDAFGATPFGDVPYEGDLPMRLSTDPGPRPAGQASVSQPTATEALAAARAAEQAQVSAEAQRRIAQMQEDRASGRYGFEERPALIGETDLSQGTGLGGTGLQASSSGSSLAPTPANIAADTAASALGVPEGSFAPAIGGPSIGAQLAAAGINAVNPLLRGQDTGDGFLSRITGGRPLFGEDGIIPPSDPFTIDDFMASQAAMEEEGADRRIAESRVPAIIGDAAGDTAGGATDDGTTDTPDSGLSVGQYGDIAYLGGAPVTLPSGYSMSLEEYLAMLNRMPGGSESAARGLLSVTPLNLGIGSLT